MSISVIIPTYNEATNIPNLLNHLSTWGGKSVIEVLVVDAAGSTDNLEEVAKGAKVTVVKSECTSRASQMNKGAKLARGDIFYFVHADVLPPKSFASDILESIRNGNEFGFFSYVFRSNNSLLKINSYFTRFSGIFTGGGDQTFFIRREIFETHNGFDEKVVLMEDFDFFSRLKKAKNKYEIINNDVIVSARKYDCNSYLKVNLVNLYVLTLFRLGYSPEKLKAFYQRVLN